MIDKLITCAISAARAAGDHAMNNRHERTNATHISQNDAKLLLDVRLS